MKLKSSLEHFTDDVLAGTTKEVRRAMLASMYFPADEPAGAETKFLVWAAKNGIRITLGPVLDGDQVFYLQAPSQTP